MSSKIILMILVFGCLYLIFDAFSPTGKGWIRNFVNGVFPS